MVALMPKQENEAGEEVPKEPVTTIKAYKRTVRLIAKLGALKGISQPEVLACYEKQMENDLAIELAREQRELQKKPKG